MIPYLIMLLFTIMFYSIANISIQNKRYKNIKIFILMSFLPSILISGLRYDVGIDYMPYTKIYDIISHLPLIDVLNSYNTVRVEPGYALLNFIISKFFNNYTLVFFISSFVGAWFIYRSIIYYFKYNESWNLAIIIYLCNFFFASLNGVRQSITIAIFLYISRYIYERKIKKYIIGILLASTIHLSIVWFLPMYWISFIKIDVKRFLIGSVLLLVFGDFIVSFVFENIIPNLNDKYAYYQHVSGYLEKNDYMSIFLIYDIVVAIIISLNYKHYYLNKKELIVNNMFLIFVLIRIGLGGYFLIGRINLYFSMFSIIAIPKISNYLHGENKKIIKIGLNFYYISLFFYNLYFYYINPVQNIIPYEFILR